jgi:hydrogenase nickel incorporation protein HypA/HybF
VHERPFTQKIVEAVLTSLEGHPAERVVSARVRVGEVFHLVPESVEAHFRSLTAGTPLSQARLDLAEDPLTVRCRDCGLSGGVEDHHLLLCRACGSRAVDTVSGHEIRIESVTLKDPAPL